MTFEDSILEETEDGGAIIGYLTTSPSGCPRPNMEKLTKKQYIKYKKLPEKQETIRRFKEHLQRKIKNDTI